ncbi:MAG: YcaO-like family protein, partial [Lachnospiraceae bacterium]
MVQKLKFHLSGLDLKLKEEWKETGVKSCYSVILYSDKIPFQWKGVGVTREEALENAYRKLVAQLQSVSWYTGRQDPELAGSSGFRISPDEKYRSVGELMGMHPRWYHFFYECMRKRSRRYYSEEQMWELLVKEAEVEREGSLITLSFQNTSLGITEEVPFSVLERHYGRDTVFAGDTMEEACIRGLSRLIMKHHMMQLHEMCVTPPDIPEEILLSYGKVREIVEDIRKKPGYILKLKDCSLEKSFPVVAAVLINRQNGGYLVTFGANPSLEKALEECLAALFTEHSLSHVPLTEEMIFDERELGKIDRMHNILTNFQGEYHYSFFLSETSYPFSLEDRKEPESSEESYSRCKEYFSSQGYEVYMRNISGLGCAGVQLFVPSFSENGYAPELKMKETVSYLRAAKTLDHFGTAT